MLLSMDSKPISVHPATVRLLHWANAIAMLVMISSGWQIYNASPLFAFRFAKEITLGGWLAAGLQWHFAGMWLFAINGLGWLAYGIASGHFRRNYLPLTPRLMLQALGDAVHLRLPHQVGVYNPLQRAAYLGVLAIAMLLGASGLAIWKPVQLQELTALFGGYDAARFWHFFAMAALTSFLAIHLTMVALVPRTLLPMITGRTRPSRELE